MHGRAGTRVVSAVGTVTAACHGFKISQFPSNESLYAAGLREYQKKHWSNAIAAFEKLTNDLPARDTLLPRAFWYLGWSPSHQRGQLPAAQRLSRLVEAFSDRTVADDSAP